MTQRRIAVLTGKRGGYGAMKPMLRRIRDEATLDLLLIVTDQHLNPEFGATIAEVERDFQVAAAVDMEQQDGSGRARAKAIATCTAKLADVLADLAPDIIVLYGDRGEVLAASIAAVNLAIPVAHLQGGDASGNIDELLRHAITKLAHLHFPATEASAKRLRRLGEEPWRIHVVGDNHADPIVAGDFSDPATVRRRFAIADGEAPIVVLQHPETLRRRDGYADMHATLRAVLAAGRRTIVVYPCSDQGYQDIVRAIAEVRDHPAVSVHKNIEAADFHGLLAIAAVLVGNSSAGLIETPYVRIPTVNIGERQKGRCHAENVIHCECGEDSVAAALGTALDDPTFAARVAGCARPFGDGQAYRRIVDVLKTVDIGPSLLEKRVAE